MLEWQTCESGSAEGARHGARGEGGGERVGRVSALVAHTHISAYRMLPGGYMMMMALGS